MDTPKITEINLIPISRPSGGLFCFCSFVIDNCFKVTSVGVHTKPDGSGIRLVFPDRLLPNGARAQIFHPITTEASILLEKAVNNEVQKLLAKTLLGNVKEDEYGDQDFRNRD